MKPGETNNTRPEDLKNRMLRCAKSLLGVGFGTLLFLTAIVGQAAGKRPRRCRQPLHRRLL